MIKWILQENLTKPEILSRMRSELERGNIQYDEIKVIPFSNELPPLKEVDKSKSLIVYGSTTMMLNAYSNIDYKKGLFYDSEKYTMRNYVEQWKDEVLNADGKLLKLSDIQNLNSKETDSWFVRPNKDEKQFGGQLRSYSDLKDWTNKILELRLPELNRDTEIWIAKPKNILKEWRAIIVEDQIVSICKYLENGELIEDKNDVPSEVINYTENRIKDYKLDEVFVIDIAQIESGLKIIECNCFNGTGFYDHDIEKVVSSINEMKKRSRTLHM